MTSIFQAGQPFNVVRTSSTTYQANDKDLVISSGDEVALPSPNQGATILVRPAPSIDSVKITTSNGTIGNTGETFGIYRATEPIYLVGDGTDWYARSGGDEISAIPDSAILHTPIKTGSGSTVVDEIFGNDGTNNGASFISDSNAFDGFELEFDGTDTVNFGEPPELDLNSGPITIIATVTTTLSNAKQAIVGKVASKATRGYNFYVDDGRLGWYDNGGDVGTVSNTAVDDGQKHRVAGQQAANGSVTYYVDGVSDGTASGTGEFDSGSNLLYGNREAGGWSLDGNLDNVIITDDLLTESQIESDFNSQPWS